MCERTDTTPILDTVCRNS